MPQVIRTLRILDQVGKVPVELGRVLDHGVSTVSQPVLVLGEEIIIPEHRVNARPGRHDVRAVPEDPGALGRHHQMPVIPLTVGLEIPRAVVTHPGLGEPLKTI